MFCCVLFGGNANRSKTEKLRYGRVRIVICTVLLPGDLVPFSLNNYRLVKIGTRHYRGVNNVSKRVRMLYILYVYILHK